MSDWWLMPILCLLVRLDRLLQERGLVRKNIQNETGMPTKKELLDKKTVIAIAKGRGASRNSFEKLANMLKISLEELFTY